MSRELQIIYVCVSQFYSISDLYNDLREYREKYAVNDHGMPNPDAKRYLLLFLVLKLKEKRTSRRAEFNRLFLFDKAQSRRFHDPPGLACSPQASPLTM